MNKVILIGRVGKDAENPTAAQLAKFSLATTEKWTGKDGQKQEKTEWHNVVCFGKQAETALKYIKKGMMLSVEGSIEYQKYEKDGKTLYSTSIKCDRFEFLSKAETQGQHQAETQKPEPKTDNTAWESEPVGDLPF